MSRPATAGRRCSATPTVDACARCAAPNASLTKKSPSSASARERRGSFFSSPPRKRVFSRSKSSPSLQHWLALSASSESVDSTKFTLHPVSSPNRVETGCSEYFCSGFPLGRPRCERIMGRAPRSRSSSIVGSAARIRVSSVIRPSSSSGTLKSTRTRARLPRTCSSLRSRTVFFRIVGLV